MLRHFSFIIIIFFFFLCLAFPLSSSLQYVCVCVLFFFVFACVCVYVAADFSNFDQQAIDFYLFFFLVYDKYNILIIYKDPMK